MAALIGLLFVLVALSYGAGMWRGWALGRAHTERSLSLLYEQQRVLDLRDTPTIHAERADELHD